MTIKALWAIAAIVLAACAASVPSPQQTTGPHVASINETAAAYAAYMQCLQVAANRLDDNKSDPMIIATAVEATCEPQFEATLNVFGPHANLADADRIKEKGRAEQSQLVVVVIQGLRAERAKKQTRPCLQSD